MPSALQRWPPELRSFPPHPVMVLRGLGAEGLAEQLLVVDDSADALMQLSSSHSFLLLQF